MARTAPFPNIPAIPGMNPGVWIMGGGGDGGGGNGKGGSGSGSGQGAGGANGGNEANGGGKNAGACGPGSGGGCPNPVHGGHGTTAGDPIDVVTGRVYTVPSIDLALPGTIPLRIERSYSSSQTEEDVGLGFGWIHSLAWTIEEARRSLRVIEPGANPTNAQRPDLGGSIQLPCGRLRRESWGYSLQRDGLVYALAERQGARWLLSHVTDRRGNAIVLHYEEGRLSSVTDTVGRFVRVRRHPTGRIAAFEVKNAESQGRWISFRTYGYDDRGDLITAEDGSGNATRFSYDGDHRLVKRTEAGGLSAEFRYDETGRCVESWCTRPGNDALDPSLSPLLADGTTAKGFLHVLVERVQGRSEIITSRALRGVEGNALEQPTLVIWAGGAHSYRYDGAGQLLEYTDAAANTTRVERDAAGRILRTVDPMGGLTEYTYNELGDVVEMRDAGGNVARYERDPFGSVLRIDDDMGFVASFAYDARGLLVEATTPDGGVTRMAYDALANRIAVREPDGGTRRIRYDFLGRITSFTDELGLTTSCSYDDCGRLCAVRAPSGAVTRYDHDVDGKLSAIVDADGRITKLAWGGVGVVTEVLRPDGTRVRYRYDREQDLVCVVNEAGESHRYERSGEGRIRAEYTFDGRQLRYRHDEMGRITAIREGSRDVELKYDANGRVIERSWSDGSKDEIEYDLLGRLVRAARGQTSCDYSYDLRGRITKEVQTAAGTVVSMALDRDACGRVRRAAGPFGIVDLDRDVAGRVIRIEHDGQPLEQLEYDPRGHLIGRTLTAEGRIITTPTADGLLGRVQVEGPAAPIAVRPGEPAWMGPAARTETFARAYDWSSAGLLRGVDDPRGEHVHLARDANGRVVERRRRAGSSDVILEQIGYGAVGEIYEPMRRRSYGVGGRLLTHGDVTYSYDEWGCVVGKRGADGRAWTFNWNEDNLLASVDTPDGRTTSFEYDPFARRTAKKVARDGRIEGVTRYAWCGSALVREVRTVAPAHGAPVVEERSYVVLPGTVAPLGHQDTRGGQRAPFRHYVYAPNGMPEALVGADGSVCGRIEARLYGGAEPEQAEVTPIRFPGQYADPETGLHCNGFRYYDPSTGQYLSPEPLRLEGSLRPYGYVDGWPLEAFDANGLLRTVIYGNQGNVLAEGSSGSSSPLHPAVQAALPPTSQNSNPTSGCAEPRALSNYLNEWEWAGTPQDQRTGTPPRSCRPGDPSWQTNLGQAMSQIRQDDGIVTRPANPVAPCPNCSQMIPRLYCLAGQMPPANVTGAGLAAGGTTARANNPGPGYATNANAAANTPLPAGAPTHLGVWEHDGTGWTGSTPL